MNTDTGEIREITEGSPIKENEIVIPGAALDQVVVMNRQQRREWARTRAKELTRVVTEARRQIAEAEAKALRQEKALKKEAKAQRGTP